MTQPFNAADDNQESEEPVDSGSRWRTYVLPSLALAILVVVVVGAYAIFSTSPSMAWLPVARPARIAFMSDRDDNWEIYMMDRDGNNVVNITNSPSSRDGLPIHAPGQNRLIFASDVDGPGLDVWSIGLDGEDPTNITQNPDSNQLPVSWSPDGQHIVFASDQSGVPEIILSEIGGAGTINLSQRDQAQSFDDWSATTDQFILTTVGELAPSLVVTGLAGDTKQVLTDGSYPAAAGQWSPDGQKIAYMAIMPESTTIDVFVMDAAGGEPLNLTQSASNDRFPQWSPDGSKIAFVSDRDGNSEIYVMNADGSSPTNLTNSPGDDSIQGDFSWSPDGAQILFHTDRDNNIEVYVIDADGGNQVNLTNSPATDYFATWVQ
jgi:Tol biopolymer transport system component